MSYIDESLAPGETIVARFHLHWTAKGRLILGIVLIPLVVGIFITIYEWLRLRAIELGVTSHRVVYKTGTVRSSAATCFASASSIGSADIATRRSTPLSRTAARAR